MKFLKESTTRKYGCLSTGPIGNAEKKKFSLFVPMFQTCDPGAGPVLTPGAS